MDIENGILMNLLGNLSYIFSDKARTLISKFIMFQIVSTVRILDSFSDSFKY